MVQLAVLNNYDLSQLEPHDADCRICLESLTIGDAVHLNCCKKYIHRECFIEYLHHLTQPCCVNCRAPFDYIQAAGDIEYPMDGSRTIHEHTQKYLSMLRSLPDQLASDFINWAVRIVDQRRRRKPSLRLWNYWNRLNDNLPTSPALRQLLDDENSQFAISEWFKAIVHIDQQALLLGLVPTAEYNTVEVRAVDESRSSWI